MNTNISIEAIIAQLVLVVNVMKEVDLATLIKFAIFLGLIYWFLTGIIRQLGKSIASIARATRKNK